MRDFSSETKKFQTDYLHVYEGVKSEIHHTSNYDENNYTSTTYMYLGKAQAQRLDNCRGKDYFKMKNHSRIIGSILDGENAIYLLTLELPKFLCLRTST